MNIIRYSIRSFFTNEYYSIIRFASKRLFVATLLRNLFRGCEAEGFQLDGDTITVRNQDPDIFRMIVEHCYNRIKSSPSRKSFRFLIDLYIMAARLKIKPLQVLAINYILKSLVKY